MPRTARASVGGVCYHVINRGNRCEPVFHKKPDYEAFVALMGEACERLPMRILAYCLMPNHFHLILWPLRDGDLGRWMQRLMTAHVRRYHRHHGTDGHVWQGRFKAFPIQQDEYLLVALRYVERNPLRANLVKRAEEWPWSSLKWWGSDRAPGFLAAAPIERPADWRGRVNRPDNAAELAALRRCANRGTPLGAPAWVEAIAKRLGLEFTLRDRGRPRKTDGTESAAAKGGKVRPMRKK